MKRGLKILGTIIAVLLVAAIALPFLVDVNSFRPRLESELSTTLGRQVKVGNLGLSLLSGSVTAENITIADDPAFSKSAFITAKSLKVGVEMMPLIFSKTLHVTDLTLEKPEIFLIKSASNKWNFSSIGANSGSSANAPKTEAKKDPAPGNSGDNLSIARFDVKDARISVARASMQGKTRVYDDVDLSVRDFSFTSAFPFTLSGKLPAGGELKLDGKAGPINASDAALTPLTADLSLKDLDLAASGFVEPSSGIAGVTDFEGTLTSDGQMMKSSGTVKADKLKLSEKGAPAGRTVNVKYAIEHNMEKESGRLTQGDISMGKALAQLTGSYNTQGKDTLLDMKLNGQNMPVDDLQAMLPAVGVVLPSGSSLKGGTLSTTLGIAGPTDKLVITGPLKLADTKLAGFDLSSKLSAISKFTGSGGGGGQDTSIQNLSTNARVAPEGIRTDNVNLAIPALGVLTGNGTISPGGALDYKMSANLAGGAVTGLTQMAGLGNKGGAIPFFIKGTTSSPSFVPDVQGMLGSQLKGGLGQFTGQKGGQQDDLVNSVTGLFGKKKKTK